MTSTLNSTRMTIADQTKLPLIADVAFNEMFTSSALNRKFLGIARPGIYRGFNYKIGTGLKLIIGDDSGKNTAYVERDGYTMTIQGQHAQTVTLPAGRRSAIVLEGFYEYGVKTRQVDKEATADSAAMKVIPYAEIADHHVVICEVNVPVGATQITEAMITEENRVAGGIDLHSHIDVTKDPHQQYALRARRINTAGPLRGGRDLHGDVNLTIDTATTARLGVVKLYDNSDSASTSLGVTANALKKERERAQAVENTKYNKSGGTISGNVVVDNGATTSLTVKANDNGNAEIAAYGDVSGTGRLFVGQSQTYGGGIEYNGDSNPVTSDGGSDYVTLYRRTNGVNHWTARFFHSNNDWEFRGALKTGENITIGGGSSTVDRLLNLQGFNAAQIGMWATEDQEKHGAFFGYHGTSDCARIAVKNNGAVRDVWLAERATGKGTFKFQQTFAGGIVSNGDIVATSGKRVVLPSGDSHDKLNLWGGAGTFAIGMHAGQRYGWLNDHAMTFTMNNVASRGWLWRTSESTADQGAMSLTTDGRLMVGHRIGFANNQTTWMQDGGSSIRIVSPYGYMNIGSTNENWAHFTTDRKGYYFDKPIHVNGMIGSYSDNDLQLHRGGSVRFELKADRNVSNQKLVAPLFQVGNANTAGQLCMGSTENAKPRIFQAPFKPDASGPDWTKEFGYDHSKTVDGEEGAWYFDTEVLIKGSRTWHAGNDGAGSGLDADLLDGFHASHFPRKAEGATITANWAFDGKVTLNTKEGAKPLEITRLGSPSETLSIWRTDTTAIFQISEDQSESDQSLGTFLFQGRQEIDAPEPVAFLAFNQTYFKYLGQHVYHDGYHPIADRWSTPRTLRLTGDLSGSVSIDGSGDVSLSASVANNSHTHDSLEISDTRASARSPNDLPARALYPQFTNQDGPFDGAWASKISVKGWTNDYGVWELAAGSNSTKQYGLHFRTGLGTAWEKWERVFTSEYHPNADKLTTARTISLGGDLTGSVAFDGSANVTLSAAVKDNSHLHTIANVTGLQTALTSAEGNAKAYTDSRISELLGGAPAAALDTIKELGDALMDNDSDIAAINATLAKKLDKTGKAADSNKLDGLDSLAFGQLAKAQTWTGLNTFGNGQINLTGDLQLLKGTHKTLQVKSTNGYIDIGAQNTSYAHIYTDRPGFYLNKEIRVLNNRVYHDAYHPDADALGGIAAENYLRKDQHFRDDFSYVSSHYSRAVLVLIPLSTTTASKRSALLGHLTYQRGGAGSMSSFGAFQITAQCAYNTNKYALFSQNNDRGSQLCTFTYNGVQYLGLDITSSNNAQNNDYRYTGYMEGADDNWLKVINYTGDGTSAGASIIVNAEINDSLVRVQNTQSMDIPGSLSVSSDMTVQRDLNVSRNLSVSGAATIGGPATFNSELSAYITQAKTNSSKARSAVQGLYRIHTHAGNDFTPNTPHGYVEKFGGCRTVFEYAEASRRGISANYAIRPQIMTLTGLDSESTIEGSGLYQLAFTHLAGNKAKPAMLMRATTNGGDNEYGAWRAIAWGDEVVKNSGNQTVSGLKTFENGLHVNTHSGSNKFTISRSGGKEILEVWRDDSTAIFQITEDAAEPDTAIGAFLFKGAQHTDAPKPVTFMELSNSVFKYMGGNVYHDAHHPNADKLTTARTISLGGDLTGSVTFDGSENITLNAEVKSDSHTHDASTVRSVGIQEGSVTRLKYPKGGSFQNRTNDSVGAIQITLPVKRTSTMMQMEIGFFDFTDNESFTMVISGYNYTSGWMNVTATVNGSSANREFKVRFGNDGTKDVIIIGEVNSTWSHPAVAINEVLLSYGNNSISTWYQGWNIKLITALPANIDDETTTVLPVSSIATKLRTARTISLGGDLSGSANFDGSANVTISATVKDDSHLHTTLKPTDNRTVKPTEIAWSSLRTYFTSLAGLNGSADSDYHDLITLNTFTDSTGGYINALAFDKTAKKIRHYQAAKTATAWGTPEVIAYESSNVASATKLKTARTISLGGDLSGSANFDGSANITITATVKDDSHAHIISNIDGLQAALDGKAAKTNAVLAGTHISMPNMGEGMSFKNLGDNRHGFNDIRQINMDDSNAPTDGAILFTADKAAKGDGLVDIFLLSRTGITAFQKITGTVTQAEKLATARTITVGGDLTGSVAFDGSANVTLSAAVKDNSHLHTIANVTGLQTALTSAEGNAKAYTDNRISELLGGAPIAALDTIKELGDALMDNDSDIAAINATLAKKLDKTGKAADADKLDGKDSTHFAAASTVTAHTSATNNPHKVTKAQVGLGNVSNFGATSDYKDASTTKFATAKAVNDVFNLATSSIPVGVPLPWPTDTAPAGWALMHGQAFDPAVYPELAKAYPSHVIPDMRGLAIVGRLPEEAILAYEADQIKGHTHAGSIGGADLGRKYTSTDGGHSHGTNTGHNFGTNGLVQETRDAAGRAVNTTWAGQHSHFVDIGWHGHSISISATGGAKNTIQNRKFNYIVRLK